ncbi:MAG: glycoside hydrolase family 15 protein [Myxococcales bacterium]|nr:glycoside hydrolase family 15 protein [Myxococcales bacterium]
MDLLSAARHLGRPFTIADADTAAALPIAARGLIGDGFTAALVAVDGAVDWLCLPRFDSPSVFARLLDARGGGSMAVRPAACPFEALQAYDPDTNVLETVFRGAAGEVRLVDSMPWSDDPRASNHELHRRVDCPGAPVEVEVVFDPRFAYGADVPRIEVGEHGVVAEGRAGERLALAVSQRLTWRRLPDGGVRATVTLRSGQSLWCVLSWGRDGLDHVDAHRPFEHLRATRRSWRAWASKLEYDGPWRHHVLRAALALKLLMYAPTGAVVAAPTTSLPEWIGGPRNWDYRFTWARDAAMAIRAANLLGYRAEARDFYHFLRDAVDTEAGLALMYDRRARGPDRARAAAPRRLPRLASGADRQRRPRSAPARHHRRGRRRRAPVRALRRHADPAGVAQARARDHPRRDPLARARPRHLGAAPRRPPQRPLEADELAGDGSRRAPGAVVRAPRPAPALGRGRGRDPRRDLRRGARSDRPPLRLGLRRGPARRGAPAHADPRLPARPGSAADRDRALGPARARHRAVPPPLPRPRRRGRGRGRLHPVRLLAGRGAGPAG